MSETNVDNLSGRGLDAAVAEEVFGWTYCDPDEEYPRWRYGDLGDEFYKEGTGVGKPPQSGSGPNRYPFPRYSTDITSAWGVVERLIEIVKRMGLYCPDLEISPFLYPQVSGHRWCVSIKNDLGSAYMGGRNDVDLVLWSSAETAPLAICRAALKAVRAYRQAEGE